MLASRSRLILMALLVVASAAGCDAANAGGAEAQVRDSAGVAIVENQDPAWTEETRWEVGSTPEVTIGATEGGYDYLFDEILGAARLSDGRLVVLNGGTAELRFFSGTGEFISAAGGSGGGPGEFNRIPTQMLLGPGDTISVLEMPASRVVRFDGSGTYIDRRELDRALATAQVPAGSFSEGVSILSGGGFMVPVHEIPPRPEPVGHRRPGGYLAVSGTGQTRLMEPFPYNDFSSIAFGRSSLFGIGSQGIALGDNETYEVSIYSPEGGLKRRVRNLRPNRPVQPEDVAARRERLVQSGRSPEQASDWAKDFDEADLADTFPAFSALLIDRLGCLWVRHPHPMQADEDTPIGWDVYDPNGIFLGELSLPIGLFLHDVGEDYLLGVRYNELDVETVELYGLTRG